jgi:thiol-disulfide isomerase/thioredoxin
MKRILLALCLPLWMPAATLLTAQDAEVADAGDLIKLPEDLNDAKELNKFFGQTFQSLLKQSSTDPDAAEAQLNALAAALEKAEGKVEAQAAKTMMARAKGTIGFLRTRIELARVTIDSLKESLSKEPGDAKALGQMVSKVQNEIAPITRSEPLKADKQLQAALEFLAGLKDKTEDEAATRAIDNSIAQLKRMESRIADGKRLAELIGSKAMELNLTDWANGEPITNDQLKGKVVLLDFWAVWCGPCIATFPHLREWHEKYADKGLEIIGLTRYYNYTWDEEADRHTRSKEEVAPEVEREMLGKFAAKYELKHRFGIQNGSELSEHYGVTGIPQAVLIDREGIVRMIRVGSGEKNAKDLDEMIAELIGK